MQIDDLVRLYQSKSDGELLQLAGQADQLTPEAHSQLSAELFRRRIPFPSKTAAEENSSERAVTSSTDDRIWVSSENIDDLTRRYQSKSDDELVELAAQAEQLTQEAHSQLAAELFRRRIPFPSRTAPGDQVEKLEAGSASSKAWPGKESSEFIAEVLRLYHGNSWTFIKFVAPAVLVGSVAVILGRKLNLQIAYAVFRSGSSQYSIELLEMQLVHLATMFISWIVSCVAYSGICSVVHQLETGSPVLIRESLLRVFEQPGRFLRISTLLGFLCLFVFALTAFGVGSFVWFTPFHWLRLSRSSFFIVSLVVSWALLVVLSRFALAIPAVVLDGYKVGQSMFRSDELTEGKWLVLAALVCKSYIGGYIAAAAPYWLARWIPDSVSLPSWFSWVLYSASVAAVTLVEPPIFIGFALLYLEQSAALPPKSAEVFTPQLG